MAENFDSARYSPLRRLLHWFTGGLIVTQISLMLLFKSMQSLELGAAVLDLHLSLGVVILVAVVAQTVLVLVGRGAPASVYVSWRAAIPQLVHLLLLAVAGLMSAVGIATAWARGNDIPLLFLVRVPAPFAPDADLAEKLFGVHIALGVALLALIAGHLGAVGAHWLRSRRNVTARMLAPDDPRRFRNKVPVWAQLGAAFGMLVLAAMLIGHDAIVRTGRMAALGEQAYDGAFQSLASVRSAEIEVNGLAATARAPHPSLDRGRVEQAESDLADATAHAPDAQSRSDVEHVLSRLHRLNRGATVRTSDLDAMDTALEDAALTLTGEAFQARAAITTEAARAHDLILITFAPAILLAGLAALIVWANVANLLAKLRHMVRTMGSADTEAAISVDGEGEFAGLMRDVLRSRDAFATQRARAATAILFDNAEEGFLTVGASLTVGPQFSTACVAILGEAPAGKSIVDLLCGARGEGAEGMRITMESVFTSSSSFARELKLELLPREFERDGKFIRASYKFLAESDRLMLILTDVSETILLAREVDQERKRLEMIVLGFTEGETFSGLINDYRHFLRTELEDLVARLDEEGVRSEFYRRLHTFKGLLAQFSFALSPASIHEVETRLAANASLSAASSDLPGLDGLDAAFERDLANVSDLLGVGFDAPGGRVLIPQQQVRAMEQLARAAVAGASGGPASAPLNLLLQTLTGLGTFNAKSALGLHARGAPPLAERLEKELEPVIVDGDDVPLPPDRYGDFFRSLVHVFRNAVDHGIEAPEVRVGAGKPAAGSIRCNVREDGDVLKIRIADDGGGIDRVVLERKLISEGKDRADVERLPLSELVFREGLSSRETAGHVSGRGVGLTAVKAELDRLGGVVEIETEMGIGTAFTFILPRAAELHAEDRDPKPERMAV